MQHKQAISCYKFVYTLLCPTPRVGALSDGAHVTSVCLLRISGLSREQRPMKAKIGTEVSHVTRDSGTAFKVKGQLAGGGGILWRPPAQLVEDGYDCVNRFSSIRLHYQ